ncbi:hypothetical protein VCHC32A1_2293, partial [Vibrio cholerae HC-32A1]
MIAHRHADCA